MPAWTVVMVDISPEDYPLFLAGLPADHRLPPQYEEWINSSRREEDAHRSAGLNTHRVSVHYGQFTGFLERIGLKPSYALLISYAKSLDLSDNGRPGNC